MKIYRQDRTLAPVELGDCDEARALHELRTVHEAGLQTCASGEEAMGKTGSGLARSEKDFLEVSCHGRDAITFHSDRLCFPSRFSHLFAAKGHFWIKADRATADQVVRDYFQKSREEFEATYEQFVVR